MNTIRLTFLFAILALNTVAQTFADKSFFLVDSIDLEQTSDYDKALLEKYLTSYHNASHDTAAIAHLGKIIDECWDNNIWPKYNWFIRERSAELLENETNEDVRKKYYYFQASTYGNEGWLYNQKGNQAKEEESYLIALDLFRKAESDEGIGQIYSFLGTVAEEKGDYIKGLEYAQKGLEICVAANDSAGMMSSYENLAFSHRYIGNYEIAEEYGYKAMACAQATNSKVVEARINLGLANVSYAQGKIDSARVRSKRALNLAKQVEGTAQVLGVYNLLGEIALGEMQIDSAIVYFNAILEQLGDAEPNTFSCNGYLGLSSCYYHLKEYEKSLSWAVKAYQTGLKVNQLRFYTTSSKNLMQAYEKLNQPDSALKYSQIFIDGKMKTLSDDNKKNLFQQSAKYDFDRQKEIDDLKFEQEIALERSARQRNASIMYSALFIVLVLSVGAFFIYKQLKTIRGQKVELAAAYEQLEESKKNELIASNLKALQSQMNPHFIFNALNSVQDLVLLKDVRSSNKYLGKFSDLIRKILLSSQKQYISLHEEIETLQLYLDLEKLRFGDGFTPEIKHQLPETVLNEQQVPAMFIQPFAENAMKHGLFHKKGDKHLTIAFESKANKLVCTITDNGIGLKAAATIKAR
ncbi:MAG: tetratricopeptide repeat-containing sensor histidine kinase, partial [Flavobacteriales bacterium]